MHSLLTIALMMLLSACIGCASIVSKSKYPVTINSRPEGASVTVKNKIGMEIHIATTPTTVVLNASAGLFKPERYSIEFEKEGYVRETAYLTAVLDNWYAGNMLFGGMLGLLIVDPATGAMYRLDDAVYRILSPDPVR